MAKKATPLPIGHEAVEMRLRRPVAHFDLDAELSKLRQQDVWIHGRGPSSTTLVKHADLRLVLTLVRAGERLGEHRTDGRLSLHLLAGALQVEWQDPDQGRRREAIAPGEILSLDQDVPFSIEARAESAFLLTVAWLESKKNQGNADRNREHRADKKAPRAA